MATREAVVPRQKTRRTLVLVLAACMALASPAFGQETPGAGGDEYSEALPNGGGAAPTKDIKDGPGDVLPPAAARGLAAQGTDGATAAELAAATAPPSTGRGRGSLEE